MAALHLGLEARGHAVVAQIIEAELGVRAVGDVAGVLRAADCRRLVVLDATDGQPEELVHFPHPLGVARGEVIVDRHEMGVARERVQVQRHGGDERLAFARRHFRDPALVQRDAAEDLHVERHHVPFVRLAAHRPFLADEAGGRRSSPRRTLPATGRPASRPRQAACEIRPSSREAARR